MRKYILPIIVSGIFCITVQLKAEKHTNKVYEEDPMRTEKKISTNITISEQDIKVGNITVKSSKSNRTEDREPDRIEQKTFSNISDIELDHKYGNIIVKESNSNDVKVEIHYFDSKEQKAACEIVSKNKILIINTLTRLKSIKDDSKINYIINLPKNVGISTLLEYGNMKADKISSSFDAKLSYSNLNVESFANTKPSITVRYGDLSVNEAQDMSVLLAYSNFTVKKAKTIDLSGNYNKINADNVNTINLTKSSAYNTYSIGSIADFKATMKYDKIKINNLTSSFNVSCAYTDVIIGIKSPKVKDVKVNGAYSDIVIDIESGISASFDIQAKYGDLIVSKAHTVKYTEQTDRSQSIQKKGQIGTKNPTLNITAINKYSDIKIK